MVSVRYRVGRRLGGLWYLSGKRLAEGLGGLWYLSGTGLVGGWVDSGICQEQGW